MLLLDRQRADQPPLRADLASRVQAVRRARAETRRVVDHLLKQAVGLTVGNLWTFQHAHLYTETERLAKAGLLDEEREEGGRRRRTYTLTRNGRRALDEWRAEPATEVPELRDLGVLKLFMGADPEALGRAQAAAHERRLEEYYEIRKLDHGLEPRGPWTALDCGIEYERHMIRFWRRLADSSA